MPSDDDDDESGVRAFPSRPPKAGEEGMRLTPAEQEQQNNLALLETYVEGLSKRVQVLEREREQRGVLVRIDDAVRIAASKIEELLNERQNRLRDTLSKWRNSVNESLARAFAARRAVSIPPVPEPPPRSVLPSRSILPPLPHEAALPPARDPDPRRR